MIVGEKIITKGLIQGGSSSGLKNGTYDLTIGEIFPVGKEAARERGKRFCPLSSYTLAPQEMVWVISKESFAMPDNVTGLATLRTTLTHQGLLSLNVGIIDSHFNGQISTVIINFSDLNRTLRVGDPFFRVIFFDHAKVSPPNIPDKPSNWNDVFDRAAGEFPKNFLNLPGSTDEYYGKQLEKLVWGFIKTRPIKSLIIAVVVILIAIGSFEEFFRVYNTVDGFLKDPGSQDVKTTTE